MTLMKKLKGLLVVLIIIGILLFFALPYIRPVIAKTKGIEAQTKLKNLHALQRSNFFMYSKYSLDLNEIDFQAPKTVNENGTGNYIYEMLIVTNNSFKARATAITDFDGDGIFNVWEIDENLVLKETVED